MRWFGLSLAVLWGALSLSANADAQDKLSLNQTYRDAIRLKLTSGSTQIPLPEGEWVLTGLEETFSDEYNERMLGVYLVRVENDVLAGAVSFKLPDGIPMYGWSSSRFCDRENILFIETKANYDGGDVDCWGINHNLLFSSRKPAGKAQTIDFLLARGIVVPLTFISMEYRRADPSKFVWSSYLVNPNVEGISPDASNSWRDSEWHHQSIVNYPEKVAYIERLKSWGREWKAKVDAGFLGKLEVFKTKEKSALPKQSPKAAPPACKSRRAYLKNSGMHSYK